MQTVKTKSLLLPKNAKQTLLGETRAFTLNIYRGCTHGCIYCDSRSDCYHVEDFDTIRPKERVLEILELELKSKRRSGIANTGSMTDPYNPLEAELQLTRKSLELFKKHSFGASLITKSASVIRDIDLFQDIHSANPFHLLMTITTPKDTLSTKIEPYVSSSSQRFKALKELHAAGLYTGIFLSPLLPFITDSPDDLQELLELAAESGVTYIIAFFGVTLRAGSREFFYRNLDKSFPGLKERYQQTYGLDYSCSIPNASLLYEQFYSTCRKLGIMTNYTQIREKIFTHWANEQFTLF